MSSPVPMPQFPLGSVLVPGTAVPLQVFEPRYRTMVADLLDDGGRFAGSRFGVTLIARGHEVGGGELRSDIGTAARIVDARRLADGRATIVALGEERIRILRWLDDDPYPLAEVEPWPDEPDPAVDPAALADTLATVSASLRRTWALAAEAGHRAGPLPEITAEPSLGSMQLLAAAPLGPFDRQRLLEIPSTGARLRGLGELLTEAAEMFELEIRAD